ncbi:helix-turn-helix domain-containing protein [Microtetraspora sp. AC03309]|uniref:helix-turn-helix domain-containing protein n=1 Tax=Microtetraspora sp. AC03309 TaxID=2779376 RepID=UPI001E2DB690|nr:helix-turn-helix domain-containing protein [Microtetraspora sp. AC03309]
MMAAESAQTLERGLRLLRLLADGNRGRTPTELAQELGLSRPVVYRLITTLQNEGFARRDAEGRVHLGFGVLVMAQAVQPLLRAAALPALRALAERVGATAHLTVAEGDDGVAVAVVEPSWTDMHLAYREGSRHPLTRGAAGLAILALRDEAEPETAATRPFLVTEGQLQEGARGIAVPLRGLPWLEASVGVVTFGLLDVDTVGPRVVEAARDLAHTLAQ